MSDNKRMEFQDILSETGKTITIIRDSKKGTKLFPKYKPKSK